MHQTLKALNLDHLSVTERIEVAQMLWDSIADAGQAAPLTEAQKTELDARVRAINEGRMGSGEDWETVTQRIREKYHRGQPRGHGN